MAVTGQRTIRLTVNTTWGLLNSEESCGLTELSTSPLSSVSRLSKASSVEVFTSFPFCFEALNSKDKNCSW